MPRTRNTPCEIDSPASIAIEILDFAGCPNAALAVDLVERVARDIAIEVTIAVTHVEYPEVAAAHRFLGSPTIRVEGSDVEPGADARTTFSLACRIYRTARGARGLPDEQWVAEALRRAASARSGSPSR